MRWGQFKSNLADAIVAHLEPIQQKYYAVIADKTYLDQVLNCFLWVTVTGCTYSKYWPDAVYAYTLHSITTVTHSVHTHNTHTLPSDTGNQLLPS